MPPSVPVTPQASGHAARPDRHPASRRASRRGAAALATLALTGPGLSTGLATPASAEAFGPGVTVSGSAPMTPVASIISSPTIPITHYAAPIRRADGTIDAEATLTAVQARGRTGYDYVIFNRSGFDSARDWASLPGFLTAAARRRMPVTVMLVPPSESSALRTCSADAYPPFYGSYDRWFTEVGRLAARHPNLTEVWMDDYGDNSTARPGAACTTFRPGTLTRWRSLVRTAAGRPVRVRPVMYYADFCGLTARTSYAAVAREVAADGVIWPYEGVDGDAARIRAQYAAIRRVTGTTMPIAFMTYGWPYRGRIPTEATVAAEIKAGLSLSPRPSAIVVYHQPLR